MAIRIGAVSNVPERVDVSASYIKKELFEGRSKRKVGDSVGLTQFGVNYTILEPGSHSALRHWHMGEDEFIYVVEGPLILIDEQGSHELRAGSFAGYPAGDRNAHHVYDHTGHPLAYLEVGSRRPGADTVYYPDDDFGPAAR